MFKKSIKFADDEKNDRYETENEDENNNKLILRFNKSKKSLSDNDYEFRTVEIRLIILKLGNISSKENTFSCEAFMEASWLDKSSNNDQSKSTKNDFKPYWTPNLYIKNLVSHQTQEIWYDFKETHLGLKISEKRRFKGDFSQTFDLRTFPFDQQELSISISTYHNSNNIKLVHNKEKLSLIELSSFTQTHEWNLNSSINTSESIKQNDFSSETHSCIDFTICVTRKPVYYFWNSFLLIFIITTICLCCFSIRCDIAANRLIVGITVFLTLITFKWSLSKNQPSISYLTCLDKYTLANIFMVFLNCIYYSIMGSITSASCPLPYIKIDLYAFIASLILFVLLSGSFLIRAFVYIHKNSKKLKLRNEEYKKFDSSKRARIKSIFQSS
jgi:hypothetical protein